MKNNIFYNQIEYERNARSIDAIMISVSFALSFCGLQASYHNYLQNPTLGNELKYEFKQLGAAQKIRKQDDTYMANERRWAWKNQDW